MTPQTLDPITSRSGELVDTAGPRNQARVARNSWLTPGDPGPWPELHERWSMTWALESGPSSPGTSGQARGTSGTVTRFQGRLFDPTAPHTRSRVIRDSWSTPRAPGPWPQSPGTAGRRRRHWNPGLVHPGLLVRPADPRTVAQVTRDSWLTPRGFVAERESSGTAGHPRWPKTQGRVARERWWTQWSLGHECELPGRACPHCGLLEPCRSSPL